MAAIEAAVKRADARARRDLRQVNSLACRYKWVSEADVSAE